MKNRILKISIFISLNLLLISTLIGATEELYPPLPSRREAPEFQKIFQQVDEYLEKEKPQEAIAELERIIKEYPKDALVQVESYFTLGDIYHSRGNYDKAVQALRSALENCPLSKEYDGFRVVIYYRLGSWHGRQGEYDKSMAILQELITKYPDATLAEDVPAAINACLKLKGESDKAPEILKDLAKKYPKTATHSGALLGLAYYYEDQKDYPKAAAEYLQVIDKFPKSRSAKFAEGHIGRLKKEGKIKLPLIAPKKVLTRQQLVRLIGIPLVALIALIYLSILIVRWRKKK